LFSLTDVLYHDPKSAPIGLSSVTPPMNCAANRAVFAHILATVFIFFFIEWITVLLTIRLQIYIKGCTRCKCFVIFFTTLKSSTLFQMPSFFRKPFRSSFFLLILELCCRCIFLMQ